MKAFFIGAGAFRDTFHSTETPVPVAAEFGKMLLRQRIRNLV